MCLISAFLHKLGLFREHARSKGIFPFKLTLVIPLTVIGRCVVSDCIAGTLFVVVFDVPFNFSFEVISSSALAYLLSAIPAVGVVGIWWSVPIGWFLADATGLIYYFKKVRGSSV